MKEHSEKPLSHATWRTRDKIIEINFILMNFIILTNVLTLGSILAGGSGEAGGGDGGKIFECETSRETDGNQLKYLEPSKVNRWFVVTCWGSVAAVRTAVAPDSEPATAGETTSEAAAAACDEAALGGKVTVVSASSRNELSVSAPKNELRSEDRTSDDDWSARRQVGHEVSCSSHERRHELWKCFVLTCIQITSFHVNGELTSSGEVNGNTKHVTDKEHRVSSK